MLKRRDTSPSPSNSMLVPLQTLTTADDHYSSGRQLAIVQPFTTTATATATTTTSRFSQFKLPNGWGVEEVPRSDSARVDRYYYEPGTGNKFRSLRAVERYISGEECAPQSRSLMLHNNFQHPRCSKMIIYGGKLVQHNGEDFNQGRLAIVASAGTSMSTVTTIPDGWVVEKVPRRNCDHSDKYYYEPGTGRKFRSQASVMRHLSELKEDMPLSAALEEIKENKPLSKAFKLGNRKKNSVLWKKNFAENDKQTSSFLDPPKKINWVLASPKGDTWNPFIFEKPVPDSVKQQWNQRFKSAMGDKGRS